MKLPALALAALLCAGSARAAVTIYTSREDFDAVTTTQEVDDYNDLPVQQYGASMPRTTGIFSYTVSVTGNTKLWTGADGSDAFMAANGAADMITLSNFTPGVSAVGGYFFGSNISGNSVATQTIWFTLVDADGTQYHVQPQSTKSTFIGFVSDHDIVSVTFHSGSTEVWASADNVVVAVPEAGSAALAGLGLLGWIARRRR